MHTEGERFDEILELLGELTDGVLDRTEFLSVVEAARDL